MLYTGRKDEKTTAWAEEERFDINALAGRGREIGGEGQSIGCQQERISGTDGQRSSIVSDGTRNPGGMIDHLIDEYSDQVAIKKEEDQRIQDEIARLESKIQGLKVLREDLKAQVEAKV
nr:MULTISPECIES: hypothetical protein [unclassified Nostoc]